MKDFSRSEKLTLFVLSLTLLLGMALSYARDQFVPFSLKVVPDPAESEKALEASKLVSLTRGDEGDFVRLPRIGPALARRIIAYRQEHGFHQKEDLLNVKGIGAKTYEEIKESIVLE
ncbi:MAG: helix-hairpin-helix domain-containing protein [Candidatus Omnitrophota bacterium]